MVQDNKEIEIKVAITDIKEFEKKISALNPQVIEEIFERTIRFDTNNEDLEKKGIFVRIRSGAGNTWTVKKKINDAEQQDKYFQRNEWEVSIDNIETARKMLKVLGFEKEFIMEKYRKKFILPKAEITIDRLPFGTYAEIEANKDEIDRLTKILGINQTRRIIGTYWHLHEEYNKIHGLTEKNIIFL
ncbi:MAG: class IV adenylate cyclase [bacterium]|nr:class IV adenylate cyclase [bacterium]